MLKILKVIEEINEEDEDNNRIKSINEKDNQLITKICLANQKNELINIVFNQLYKDEPYLDRYEINRHIDQFIADITELKKINHHFNSLVVRSLFNCLKNSNNRFLFIKHALREFNLMCYGAKTLGKYFDEYWHKDAQDKLDNTVIEKIIEIWETRECS